MNNLTLAIAGHMIAGQNTSDLLKDPNPKPVLTLISQTLKCF